MAAKIEVQNLTEGQIIDLATDMYADPSGNDPYFAYQYAEVVAVEQETPECVLVHFTETESIGFPTGHLVALGA